MQTDNQNVELRLRSMRTVWMALLAGQLLHFPRSEHVVNASFRSVENQ